MSFGMAFFSITMLLNVAGFHVTDLKHVDLSTKGIQKAYYTTEARVVRSTKTSGWYTRSSLGCAICAVPPGPKTSRRIRNRLRTPTRARTSNKRSTDGMAVTGKSQYWLKLRSSRIANELGPGRTGKLYELRQPC